MKDKIHTINSYYPKLAITSIDFLGAGYDSEAYVVNEEFVFKFPRHATAAANLYKEAHVLMEIRDQLPINVPEVLFTGPSDDFEQMVFVGYERIQGEALTPEVIQTLDEAVLDKLAKELAGFFSALHQIKLTTSIQGLHVDKKEKCQKEFAVIKSLVLPAVSSDSKDKINTLYEHILAADFEDTTCLVHNDFGASNVFFDRASNQICGIIDFGDVAIYDRDIDFVCLLQSEEEGFDQEFVKTLLTHYNYNQLDILQKKCGFNAFYAQFENVFLGYSFDMKDLLEEALASLKQGVQDYEEHVLIKQNYGYYI